MTDHELEMMLQSYTQSAADRQKEVRAHVLEALPEITPRKTHIGGQALAAAAVLIFLCALFVQTPPGTAMAATARETVAGLIQTLFPPKAAEVTLEGESEQASLTAHGQEPNEATPGFAIYVDEDRYQVIVESNNTFIRPLAATGLVCEMEISHLPSTTPKSGIEAAQTQLAENFETISDISESNTPNGWTFCASGGTAWDSPQEEVYFTSDGAKGCYQISLRYFLEAAEGHGARFRTMLETFTIVS